MAFGIGRGLATPLLVINFILYLIAACLAGWALNRNFDAARGTGEGVVGTLYCALILVCDIVYWLP